MRKKKKKKEFTKNINKFICERGTERKCDNRSKNRLTRKLGEK